MENLQAEVYNEQLPSIEVLTNRDQREPRKMADPFEVRMRFTSQLQHLNASINSSQKAAHYALKYRDMDEDLHSCILEQLERVCHQQKHRQCEVKADSLKNSMNNRANIMYFIEHFCEMAQRENHVEFVRMMQRDILRVVDAVAPADGSGAANVKVVRRVSCTFPDLPRSVSIAHSIGYLGPRRPPAKIFSPPRHSPRNRRRSQRARYPSRRQPGSIPHQFAQCHKCSWCTTA